MIATAIVAHVIEKLDTALLKSDSGAAYKNSSKLTTYRVNSILSGVVTAVSITQPALTMKGRYPK